MRKRIAVLIASVLGTTAYGTYTYAKLPKTKDEEAAEDAVIEEQYEEAATIDEFYEEMITTEQMTDNSALEGIVPENTYQFNQPALTNLAAEAATADVIRQVEQRSVTLKQQIKDPILLKYVVNALNGEWSYVTENDTVSHYHINRLTKIELTDVTDASGNKVDVKSLEGLEIFVNLEVIKINSTQTTKSAEFLAPILLLPKLRWLELANFESLPADFSQMVGLENLWIQRNPNLQELPQDMLFPEKLGELRIETNPTLKNIPRSVTTKGNINRLYIIDNSSLQALPEFSRDVVNLNTLEITDSSIREIPTTISEVPNLRNLTISDNDALTSIPDGIGNLSQLSSLTINDNDALTSIPTEVGDLSKLRVLFIEHNDSLTGIPESIGKLNQLSFLKIRYNKSLLQIPDVFTKQHIIYDLYLDGNEQLPPIPKSVLNLKKLERLAVSIGQGPKQAEPTRLPQNFGEMPIADLKLWISVYPGVTPDMFVKNSLPNVYTLKIVDTDLALLPENMPEAFPNVKELWIIDAQNTTTPQVISQFKNVREFRIQRGNTKYLADNIQEMKQIEKFVISGTKIKELPESFGELPNLKDFRIYSNTTLKYLPDSFFNLKYLEKMILNETGLKTLPDTIQDAPKLRELTMMGNPNLEALPETIGYAPSLSYIFIQRTPLVKVPESIGSLGSQLGIKGSASFYQNQIVSVPKSVENINFTMYYDMINGGAGITFRDRNPSYTVTDGGLYDPDIHHMLYAGTQHIGSNAIAPDINPVSSQHDLQFEEFEDENGRPLKVEDFYKDGQLLYEGTIYAKVRSVDAYGEEMYKKTAHSITARKIKLNLSIDVQPVVASYVNEHGEKIAEDEVINGRFREAYETKPKLIEGYELIEIDGKQSGVVDRENQQIRYMYRVNTAEDSTQQPTPAPEAPTNSHNFTDIKAGSETDNYVMRLADLGAINVTLPTFNPSNDITRGQFALMIARTLELTPQQSTSFTDIKAAETQAAVQALYEAGIVKGTSETTFEPTKKITRSQAAVMIHRLLTKELEFTTSATLEDLRFKDAKQIHSEEAKQAFATLQQAGIMTGNEGFIHPRSNLKRSQMAKILIEALDTASFDKES